MRIWTLPDLEKATTGERAAALVDADRAVLDAIDAARVKAGGVNYAIQSWLSDVDPLAELKQVSRYHEEWQAKRKASAAPSARDVFNWLENAARNCKLARDIAGIAGEVTFTAAVAYTAKQTAEELSHPWDSPVIRLVGGALAVLALVAFLVRKVFA